MVNSLRGKQPYIHKQIFETRERGLFQMPAFSGEKLLQGWSKRQ